ncbi:hypothetical protein Tco_1488655 [Tanacetum coccineum]
MTSDAESETRPPMLERGSYIPWESRFIRYLNLERETRKFLKLYSMPKSLTANVHQSVVKSRYHAMIHIVLWIVDSGYSKHMTGNLKLLKNFNEKFMGIVRFRNDHFTAITGYVNYVHGNITICHVYYVEGIGHNLFSVGQFCDGNLEVAF